MSYTALIRLPNLRVDNSRTKLEIWGKAQRESARRLKSDGGKFKG